MPYKCPHCGHEGSFEPIVQGADIHGQVVENGLTRTYQLGVRRCPRADCHGQVFFAAVGSNTEFYPVQRIDFDPTDIPEAVTKCLKEAIDCHANGNDIAAAIMVRKSLETMCEEQGATGPNLKERIKDLGSKIVMPKQLVDGMDTLRLLGNDAAHVEARLFLEIGTKELEVAIKFTKELLKNVYQYGSLLKELEDLKTSEA